MNEGRDTRVPARSEAGVLDYAERIAEGRVCSASGRDSGPPRSGVSEGRLDDLPSILNASAVS